MKSKCTYVCQECNERFTLQFDIGTPSPVSAECPTCGKNSIRAFGSVSIDKIDDTVSYAMQAMLYSKMPSNKNKTLL